MHYLLFYDYAADYMARRGEFRNEHLTLAWQSHDRGEFVLGGALAEPVDSAVLLFNVASKEIVEAFVAAVPYVRNDLVSAWRIRPWTTVAGAAASNPVFPA